MRSFGLLLHPALDASAARAAEALDPAAAWLTAESLPGGRGTVRLVKLAGRAFLLKRESRGGFAGGFLPDSYLRREPFLREWALSRWLDDQGLTPPMAARWFLPRGAALAVFSLLEPLDGAVSLASRVRERVCVPGDLVESGRCVGRLHALGVHHGDLNAGNLLLAPSGTWAIDWRHSFRAAPIPPSLRRANLDRLARSLVKVAGADHPFEENAWRALAEGYREGFGAADPWLERWASEAGRIFPLRRWLWRRRA